ncbi:MAG: hypothetical protein WDO74_32165 [Pseudomonadota bacterium]
MKLHLNVGDWATIAFFALAVVLGCYAQPERQLPVRPELSAASPNHANSARIAARSSTTTANHAILSEPRWPP